MLTSIYYNNSIEKIKIKKKRKLFGLSIANGKDKRSDSCIRGKKINSHQNH